MLCCAMCLVKVFSLHAWVGGLWWAYASVVFLGLEV